MMAKNNMLKCQQKLIDVGMDIGERYGKQVASDLFIIALHRVYGFSYERMERLIVEADMLFDHFKKYIGNPKEPECDRYREELDTLLKECLPPERFKPFEERYEGVRKVRY